MYEVYLSHHGILGQKWGIRRYQNPDGSLTAAGKLRYAPDGNGGYRKLSSSERKAAVKAANKRAEALEKARKTKAEKEKYEKEKKEAIKSGDASKINKYFNDLSPEEKKLAMDQINTKQSFQKMLNQEAQLVSQGETKMDKMMNSVAKATDWADKGIKMYNVIAKVNNAFNADSFMPTIDGSWAGDRAKKQEKEDREERQARQKENKEKQEEKENRQKEKVLNTGDAKQVLAYAKKHGNVSANELGTAIKRMQNEEGLKKIARGGEEANKVLKTTDNNQNQNKNQNQNQQKQKKKGNS